MKKNLVGWAAIISVVLIILSGCSFKRSTPLRDMKHQSIKSITIKQNVTGSLNQVQLKKSGDINQVLDYLRELEYKKLEDQKPRTGWTLWITFEGWDKSITFIDDLVYIDKVYYSVPKNSERSLKEIINKIGKTN